MDTRKNKKCAKKLQFGTDPVKQTESVSPAKRKCTYYVQQLTPTKKTSNGNKTFRFLLQSETEVTPVLGFGEEIHKTLGNYMNSKSPIKLDLNYNDNYGKFMVNEYTKVLPSTSVDFPYKEELKPHFSSNSEPVSVKQCCNVEPPSGNFFTITGKLIVGPAPPKSIREFKIKEDLYIIDNSGKIDIHIWYPLYENLIDNQVYSITHLVHKHFAGTSYMSTTRNSQITISETKIATPPNISTSFNFIREIALPHFDDVIKIDNNVQCSCGKKIDYVDASKGVIKCPSCKRFKRTSDLVKSTVVQVSVKIDEKDVNVTIQSSVVRKMIDCTTTDEEEIAFKLLSMKDIKMKYDEKSKTFIDIL